MSEYLTYEGTGNSLDEAISNAHNSIPLVNENQKSDFMHSRVIEFGKRTGGFTNENIFFAKVIQTNPQPYPK